jgi:hypothetical protein
VAVLRTGIFGVQVLRNVQAGSGTPLASP